MSQIPYNFPLPIPNYLWKHDWFKPEPTGKYFKRLYFVQWCLSRCSTKKRTIFFSHKFIELEPFEFIFGRHICSQETGLSEREIRTMIDQLNTIKSRPTLEKSTSKSTSKFTVFKIVTDNFNEIIDQQKDQQPTSNRPATDHNLDYRSKIIEDDDDDLANKIIPMDESMNDEKLIFRKTQGKTGSILKDDLMKELLALGYSVSEVTGAHEAFKKKNYIVKNTIVSYFSKIIESMRDDKKQRKSNGHENKSKQFRKNSNYVDPVQSSREDLRTPSIAYPKTSTG